MAILSNTGVAAGMANRLHVLSTPAARATNVRKHPARHENRSLEATTLVLEPAGHHPHHHGRPGHAQHTGQQQRCAQHRGYVIHQLPGGVISLLHTGCSQHRYKRLAECAFGKQTAKQIRYAKCHIERVGHGRCTKG
jgi:hypothetical protein